MQRLIAILLTLLLFASFAPKASAEAGVSDQIPGSLYGTYAFVRQLYMNPLSSFMAFDGFEEYYELTENTLTFIDASGQRRSMDIALKEEPVDVRAYESSFMMEGFGIPDIAAFQRRRQFTLSSPSLESIVYRLYLMDDQVWLANIHKDTANVQKQEYIWSIFKIEKHAVRQSVSGTQEGVKDFLALLGNSKPQMYENDTCYNITPEDIAKATYGIFKFDQSCASFLMFENEIYPLGEWFGGLGVVSAAIADLDKDGLNELIFTYSFGSGIHQSRIGYFDPAAKQTVDLSYALQNAVTGNSTARTDVILRNRDMIVAQNETGGLSLYEAAFPFMESFVRYRILGTKRIADIVYSNGEIALNPMLQTN